MGVKDILKSRLPPSALQFLRKIHRMSNMRIVNKNDIFSLPERIHLKKLFNYLRVDCVFDVGANAGQYAQMLRHNVGYHGLIISFEPIPYLADKLRAQAAKDPLWCVEEVALGEANGSFVFNIMESDRFSSFAEPIVTDTQIFSEINRVREKMLVRQETLTSAYGRVSAEQRFRRPFLKLDTQGLDVSVVQSGAEVVANFVGLQSELSFKSIYNTSVNYKDAIGIYESMGFELSAIVPNNAGHFPELVELDCIMFRRGVGP